jgi:ABC-type sugar transport system substrate-binding protein
MSQKSLFFGGSMKSKLSLLIVCIFALSVLFLGCQRRTSADGALTIAVSLNDADEYRSLWLNSFTRQAEAKGYRIISANAGSNASKQISDVENLILQRPSALVLHAFSSEGIVPALEAINIRDIPVVLFDFPVASNNYTTFITDDQGLNGEIQARFVLDWLAQDSSRRANVGYLVGMYAMEAAMPRRDQFVATLGIQPIAEQEGGWSPDGAMSIVEDWIQAYPHMNVFVAMNDDMAIGAIQALTAAGRNFNDILVLGIDGTDAAKVYLRSGQLAATAARDISRETSFTLETVEKILAGETVARSLRPNAIFAMTRENAN